MVVPIIAAGARVAGSTAVRAGAETADKIGGRTAVSTTQKSLQSGGRAITRNRRPENLRTNRINQSRQSEVPRNQMDGTRRLINQSSITRTSNNADSETQDQRNINIVEPKNKPRIGIVVSIILLYIASMFDAAELALDLAGTALGGVGVVIGYIKDTLSFLFFPTIFWLLGVPFWKGRKAKKKMVAMITGFLISLIPWVGAFLPETFISVLVTILLTRSEDKGIDAEKSLNQNIVRARRPSVGAK